MSFHLLPVLFRYGGPPMTLVTAKALPALPDPCLCMHGQMALPNQNPGHANIICSILTRITTVWVSRLLLDHATAAIQMSR